MIKNSSKPSDGFTESPSSRPMTLRQQLLDIDKLRQTHQIDNPEYIDRLVEVCQEIAREARLKQEWGTLDWLLSHHYFPEEGWAEAAVIKRINELEAELTQKPPQPPQGDSEEPS